MPNVLLNGDFADGVAGWKAIDSTIEADASEADTAPPSARVTCDVQWGGLWQVMELEPERAYAYRFRVKGPAGMILSTWLNAFDGPGATGNYLGGDDGDYVELDGSWQTVGTSWTTPAGTRSGDIGVYLTPSMPAARPAPAPARAPTPPAARDPYPPFYVDNVYLGVASWPVSIRLGDVELDLAGILADVTVRQGRSEAAGEPQPSSASLALSPVDRAFTRAFRVGVELALVALAPGGEWPLFRGLVSDAELDVATLSIVAAGMLASANRVELAIAGWPEEPWSARAARLFQASGRGYVVEPDPDFDPILAPPVNLDTGTMLFASYATSLAAAVGAAIVDTPDGRLAAQALGSRTGSVLHELDPAIVAWAPKWLQPLDVVNVLAVQYGPDDATVELVASDQASIDLYGRRGSAIQSTRIKNAADAGTRARIALDRGAYPRWSMRDVLLLEPIPNLAVGDRVLLTELPASAPVGDWAPIVEGWTHSISGGDWRLELALSDPLSSGLALAWDDLPLDVVWQAVPTLPWAEADALGDFYP